MKKTVIAVLAAVSLAGCNIGTTGIIGQNFQNIDIKNTTKRNTKCDITIPFLLMSGHISGNDSSVISIAKEKNINTVTYVDYQLKYIIPFFIQKCYTVYGY